MDVVAILQQAKQKMEGILSGVKKDFVRIRTGKASVDLLDHCRAEVYGSAMPINQLATLSVPEPRTIVISPWDKSSLSAIEKAIQSSDLGLNPNSDGQVIRIHLPQLSEDRRRELVGVAKKAAEAGRVHVRSVRREANEQLKKLEKDDGLSEDARKRAEEQVQKITDEFIIKIDEALAHKERETLEV